MLLFELSACSLAIDSFSENLNKAVLSSNDPVTVRAGIPTFVLLLDAMVESDPDDEDSLRASSDLLSSYAGLLSLELSLSHNMDKNQILNSNERIKKLTEKSLNRAIRSVCLYEEDYCHITELHYKNLVPVLAELDEDDLPYLYSLAQAWVGWLQVNRSDWNATAKLPQIKHLLEKLVELDERYKQAGGHMYLGVINSLLPQTMGGKPETGKQHFESAINISDGQNLMVKVLYAEYYARLTFNQALHQKLIDEVMSFESENSSYNLMNTLAKQKARVLQNTAKDYF